MAYPEQHVLITWGGSLYVNESWVCSVRMRNPSPSAFPSHSDINGYVQGGFKTALATYATALGALINGQTKINWIKANAVGTDGKYLDNTTNIYTWGTPIVHGTGANYLPGQISLAVSTTTAASFGLAHRGRWYLPGLSAVTASDGKISAGNATTIANASAAFLHDLNAATDNLGVHVLRCAVFSRVGAGAFNDITGVSVGRVADTQRSRREKFAEAPSTAAVT
jgi:hypothetical protein